VPIIFPRSGKRDYPSALEAYFKSRNLLNQADGVDCTVFENIDPMPTRSLLEVSRQGGRSVLIRTEPHVVSPDSYNQSRIWDFDLITSLGTVNEVSGEVMYWPQVFEENVSTVFDSWQGRKDDPVIVASDKISFVPGELYSLRREVIFAIPNIDLFGYQWDRPFHRKLLVMLKEISIALRSSTPLSVKPARHFFRRLTSYRGQVENKRATISSYKYCIVIENSATYVSEKLFDALFAGCIPIYVGPDLKSFGIPTGLVAEVAANPSAVAKGLETAKTMNVIAWDKLRLDYLKDPQTVQKWKSENVFQAVFSRIQKALEN
jgi:hypothetical protein